MHDLSVLATSHNMGTLYNGFCICQQLVKMAKAFYEVPIESVPDTAIADGAFALHITFLGERRCEVGPLVGIEAFQQHLSKS